MKYHEFREFQSPIGLRDTKENESTICSMHSENKQSNGNFSMKNVLWVLNRQVKELDPSVVDWANTGIMSRFVNPIKRYFDKYETA